MSPRIFIKSCKFLTINHTKKNKFNNRIDINNANFKEINSIQGIGRILASRIIENRPYKTHDEIQSKIKGIGMKKYSVLKGVISMNKSNKVIHVQNYICNTKTQIHSRNITEARKRFIAGKQHYKCANNPSTKLKRLENYDCPLWDKENDNKGSFDQSGFEIDHIDEFFVSHDNTEDNLQALCKSCHSVKTKKFNKQQI